MAEKTEVDSFLAAIDAKIAALQHLRESYQVALSLGLSLGSPIDPQLLPAPTASLSASAANANRDDVAMELPTGIFRDKGMADAIRLYLGVSKRKQTPKEIAAALRDGGLESTSANFEKTLITTLHRMKGTGELLQFKDGWDLAQSYPDSLRQRLKKNSE